MLENRVREARLKAGLSQFELSRRTKINQSNLCAIETFKRVAWASARKAIAKALKTTEAELFPECLCKQGGQKDG